MLSWNKAVCSQWYNMALLYFSFWQRSRDSLAELHMEYKMGEVTL